MEAYATRPPNPQVELEAAYLQPKRARQSLLTVPWKAEPPSGGLTRYVAEVPLPALPVGQHFVRWHCDVGGDISEFWRSFAVTNARTLVVIVNFTTGKVNEEFERFHLPYDYWDENVLSLLGGPLGERVSPSAARQWTDLSREHRRRGASPNFMIAQGTYAGRRGWPGPIPIQFRNEPEDLQRAVLDATLELAGMAGFDRDAVGFAAYEFGTRTVNIARAAGIHVIGSLCPPDHAGRGLGNQPFGPAAASLLCRRRRLPQAGPRRARRPGHGQPTRQVAVLARVLPGGFRTGMAGTSLGRAGPAAGRPSTRSSCRGISTWSRPPSTIGKTSALLPPVSESNSAGRIPKTC